MFLAIFAVYLFLLISSLIEEAVFSLLSTYLTVHMSNILPNLFNFIDDKPARSINVLNIQ